MTLSESVWNGGLIQEADQVVPSQKVITDLNQVLCLRVGSAVEHRTGRPDKCQVKRSSEGIKNKKRRQENKGWKAGGQAKAGRV